MSDRKSYEETCRHLVEQAYFEAPPPMPERMPRYDDEEPLGINFYKSGIEGANLSYLTLRRTFIGRSWVSETSFEGTDLSESNLCWNDFSDVSFAGADLSRCDLRASIYERVSFRGANLAGADMRRSSFDDCVFASASLVGAMLTNEQRSKLPLSETQVREVAWTDDEGEDPDGG